jgi:Ca2+-binding RTX toxin-like protein
VENLTLTGAGTINATGNTLANVITGNSGNNIILGDVGNDTIDGGNGLDTITGGAGADSINVNNGNDRLLYNSTLEVGDIVTNFDNAGGTGAQDYIDLDGLFDSLGVAAASRAARVSLVDTGADVDLRVDTDGNGSFETTVLTFSGMANTTGMTIGVAAADDIQVGT